MHKQRHLPPLPVRLALGLAVTLLLALPAAAKMSVFDSPHNLSASGGRGRASGRPGVVFSEEQQVCIFCHVPHNAQPGTPLWSREIPSSAPYLPYNESTTLNASPLPDKPTGASRLCLSCHDGTIALSKYSRSRISTPRFMPVDMIAGAPASESARVNPLIGTDLRDDHPISFGYTEILAQKSHLVSPSMLPGQIRLERGVNLECTACHDPHDNQYGNFLVMNNGSDDPTNPGYRTGAPLCASCHQPDGWDQASHNNPQAQLLGRGCLVCHSVHSAPGRLRLLNNAKMEDNCLGSCHNDSSATASSPNMLPLFQFPYRHPVEYHNPDPQRDHDEKENLPVLDTNYHVQCVDCHNPHQANATTALSDLQPPRVSGRLKGVRVDNVGNYANAEFDICFKCHSGAGADKFAGVTFPPNRVILDADQKERFNPLNPSFHPVMADRRTSGASLIATAQPAMVRVYCVDCHNSNQSTKALGPGNGPNGPHGSQYPHIMIARYDMPFAGQARLAYNTDQYALCWRCHLEQYVMESGSAFKDNSRNLHAFHVRDRQYPCFACHDPHGIPKRNLLATPSHNSHLINFDQGYTVNAEVSVPSMAVTGTDTLVPSVPGTVVVAYNTDNLGNGDCTVACHTNVGHNHAYGPNAQAKRALKNLMRPMPAPATKKR